MTCGGPAESLADFIDIGRYDWFVTKAWNRLHWADIGPEHYACIEQEWAVLGQVRLACGRTAAGLWIPGVFTRMSAPRCSGCCRALGYPLGNGSPKNCDKIRPLLGLDMRDTVSAPC